MQLLYLGVHGMKKKEVEFMNEMLLLVARVQSAARLEQPSSLYSFSDGSGENLETNVHRKLGNENSLKVLKHNGVPQRDSPGMVE